MKRLIVTILLLLPLNVFANDYYCKVYVPNNEAITSQTFNFRYYETPPSVIIQTMKNGKAKVYSKELTTDAVDLKLIRTINAANVVFDCGNY